MRYAIYKEKMLKRKKIKEIILKFRWLILGVFATLVLAFIIFNTLFGKVDNIVIDSVTYGTPFEPRANVKLSKVLRYEYKTNNSDWTTEKPKMAGKYFVRAISSGLFGERSSAETSFEIYKKDLTIDVIDTEITYGSYPKSNIDGLLSNENITLSYKFSTLSTVNSVISLTPQGVVIKDIDGDDVTDCYNIVTNAENGKDITFKKLDVTLTPDATDAVYNGKPYEYNNQYSVTYNSLGYDDTIKVTTKILNSKGVEVSEAITPDTYTILIDKIYLNDQLDTTNYTITKETKSFVIFKRSLKVEAIDLEKTYDGLNATYDVDDINILEGSLLSTDKIKEVVNNKDILNAGFYKSDYHLVINDINNKDVSSYYQIEYQENDIVVNKKNLNVRSLSASKVYDGTPLFQKEFEYSGLVSQDSINIDTFEEITNSSIKPNVITVVTTNNDNYNINYTYGTLNITKAKLSIKPIDYVKTYDANTFDLVDSNYELVSGTLYKDDKISTINVTSSSINFGNSLTSITNVTFTNDSKNNYDITLLNGNLKIEKAIVNIKPQDVTTTYDYNYFEYKGTYQTDDFISSDESNLTINVKYYKDDKEVRPIHTGTYQIVIDNIIETNDYHNYEFIYGTSTLTIIARDVDVKIAKQEAIYNKQVQNYDMNQIETETNVKDKFKVLSSTISNFVNADVYQIDILDYMLIETDTMFNTDLNINLVSSTFEILKRDVTIKALKKDDITYDSETHAFGITDYSIVDGSFVDDADKAELIVEVKDKDNKELINSDNYNMVVTSASVMNNYNVIISDDSVEFNILKAVVNISLDDETVIYDGLNHEADNSLFSLRLDNGNTSLYNGEMLSINITLDSKTSQRNSGVYQKKINSLALIGGNEYSTLTNYDFISNNDSTYTISKREIDLKLEEATFSVYDKLLKPNLISTLTMDSSQPGLVDIGYQYTTNYEESYGLESDSLMDYYFDNLRVGVYNQEINDISFIDYDLINNYIINKKLSNLNIVKKDITITLLDKEATYSKEVVAKDYDAYTISDMPNGKISGHDFVVKPDINYYKDGVLVNPINCGYYDIKASMLIVLDISHQPILDFYNESFNITYNYGRLNIKQLDITVKGVDQIVYFNNTYQSPTNEFIYLSDNKFISSTPSFIVTDSFIDSGVYYYLIEFDNLDNDLINNYNLNIEYAKFEILKRVVEITPSNQNYIYDGLIIHNLTNDYVVKDVLTSNDYINSLPYSENLVINVVYKLDNKIVYPINTGEYNIQIEDVVTSSTNYEYIFKEATLNILRRNLTISALSLSYAFDGSFNNTHFNYVVTFDNGTPVCRIGQSGYPDTIEATYQINEVSERSGVYYYNIISLSDLYNNFNYTIDLTLKTIEITKRDIYIKPVDVSSIYDAKVHNHNASFEYYGLSLTDSNHKVVDGYDINILVTSEEIIHAGRYEITISSLISNSDLYNIISDVGYYTVLPREQYISLVDMPSVVYDKEIHNDYDVTKYEIYDKISNRTYDSTFMDGTYANITKISFLKDNNVVIPRDAGNYKVRIDEVEEANDFKIIISKEASFDILKKELNVKLLDESKEYNNEDIFYSSSPEILNTDIYPEYINLDYYYEDSNGTRYQVLRDADTYLVKVLSFSAFDNYDVTNNYNLLVNVPNMTIYKKIVFAAPTDKNIVYDGKDYIYDNEYYLLDINDSVFDCPLPKASFVVTYSGLSQVSMIGIYDIKFESIILEEVNKNLDIRISNKMAKLTILKLELVVESEEAYQITYGDILEFNPNIYATNSNASFTGDIGYNLLNNDNIYSKNEILDAGTYIINFNGLDNIYMNEALLDSASYNISYKNRPICQIDKKEVRVIITKTKEVEYNKSNFNDQIDNIEINGVIDKDINNVSYNNLEFLYEGLVTRDIIHSGDYYLNNIDINYINYHISFLNNYYLSSIDSNVLMIVKQHQLEVEFKNVVNEVVYDSLRHNIEFDYIVLNSLPFDTVTILISDNTSDFVDVGEYTVAFKLEISSDISNSYDYRFDETLLYTINKRDILIRTEDANVYYNGNTYTFTNPNVLGIQVNDRVVFKSSFVDAGSYSNKPDEFYILDDDRNVIDNYNVLFEYGTINIFKQVFNVYTHDTSYVYDPLVHAKVDSFNFEVANSNYSYPESTKFNISNNVFDLSVDDYAIRLVGTYLNEFNIHIRQNEVEVTNNFEISFVEIGTLTILKKNIVITSQSLSKVFDASDVDLGSLISIKDEFNNLILDKVECEFEIYRDNILDSKVVHSGNYRIKIKGFKIFNFDSIETTNSYNVLNELEDIIVTVSKRNVVVGTDSKSFFYDTFDKKYEMGLVIDMISRDVLNIVDVNLYDYAVLNAYDDDSNFLLNNSIKNSCKYDFLKDGESYLDSFNVIEYFGTLSFNKKLDLKVNIEETYDAKFHDYSRLVKSNLVEVYPDKEDNINEDGYIELSTEFIEPQSIKTCGTYNLIPDLNKTYIHVNNISIPYSLYQQMDIEISLEITLNVNKVKLLIKPAKIVYEYQNEDLHYLNHNEFTLASPSEISKLDLEIENELLDGDYLEFETSLSGKDIGLYYAPITSFRVYNSENLDVSDCYLLLNLDESFNNPKYIKYMCQLQIKQRTFDLTSDNSYFKYDGITHFLVNPKYDETSLLDGDHVEYVGLTLPGVSNGFVILNSDNEDVTNKYTFKYSQLKVSKIGICIETASNVFDYDGEYHNDPSYVMHELNSKGEFMDGLREGDYIKVMSYSSYIVAGEYQNRLNIRVFDISNNDVTNLYTVYENMILGKIIINSEVL